VVSGIEKFPEWSGVCTGSSVIDAYEAYRKKTKEWRVQATETLEKQIGDAENEQWRLLKGVLPNPRIEYLRGFIEAKKEVLEALKSE